MTDPTPVFVVFLVMFVFVLTILCWDRDVTKTQIDLSVGACETFGGLNYISTDAKSTLAYCNNGHVVNVSATGAKR